VTGTVRALHRSDPPLVVPMPELNVSVTQGGVLNTAVTDLNGLYAINGLLFFPAAILAHLAGPHVVVHNDETQDPDTTHSAIVTPTTLDWNFAADDPSPNLPPAKRELSDSQDKVGTHHQEAKDPIGDEADDKSRAGQVDSERGPDDRQVSQVQRFEIRSRNGDAAIRR